MFWIWHRNERFQIKQKLIWNFQDLISFGTYVFVTLNMPNFDEKTQTPQCLHVKHHNAWQNQPRGPLQTKINVWTILVSWTKSNKQQSTPPKPEIDDSLKWIKQWQSHNVTNTGKYPNHKIKENNLSIPNIQTTKWLEHEVLTLCGASNINHYLNNMSIHQNKGHKPSSMCVDEFSTQDSYPTR